MVGDGLSDGVEDRHAVNFAAKAPRRYAANNLRAGAVVKALACQIDGLAAGDALNDEGCVRVYEDAHELAPILSTARLAASCIETVRSAYSTP